MAFFKTMTSFEHVNNVPFIATKIDVSTSSKLHYIIKDDSEVFEQFTSKGREKILFPDRISRISTHAQINYKHCFKVSVRVPILVLLTEKIYV